MHCKSERKNDTASRWVFRKSILLLTTSNDNDRRNSSFSLSVKGSLPGGGTVALTSFGTHSHV